MKLFGLLGYPLEHSFSKKFFEEKFQREAITNCTFENFPLKEISEVRGLLQSKSNLRGLNVTIPHKQSIIPLLHGIDETAASIGAVNCVKIDSDNNLIGFNTDAYGFEMAIKPFLENRHDRALVLGTGGSSRAVAFVLTKRGIPFLFVSRNGNTKGSITYAELTSEVIQHHPFIINTTPLGMWPDDDSFPPIPYEGIGSSHFLFDLVYNPAETTFMKKGIERGALVQNGLTMLKFQAEKSWEIWNS